MKQYKNIGRKHQGGWVAFIPAAIGVVSSIAGSSGGGSPSGAQQGANPLAPYQQGWAEQLNSLMANPSSVTNTPGYRFGMDQGAQQLQRSMAGAGQTQSGQEQIALQQYGQGYAGQQYQQQVSNLSNVATNNAVAGQTAYSSAQGQNMQNWSQTGGQFAKGLQSIYGSGQATPGSSSGTPGSDSYSYDAGSAMYAGN